MGTKGLSRSEIQAMWQGQNPQLMKDLRTNGTLADHLAAAEQSTRTIMQSSLANGLNEDQARELARDAVGLPPDKEEEEEA
jgi:hypothetical protein